jgi:hypothetical protein
MIKVSVMYPNTPGARFDHAYYRDTHMPLVKARMGACCKYYTVDKGLGGGAPGADVRWHVSHLLRLSRVIPGRIWPARERDHGRHPEVHGPDPGDSDQRGGRRLADTFSWVQPARGLRGRTLEIRN